MALSIDTLMLALYQAALVHPYDKKESKLRHALADAFGGNGDSALWKSEEGGAAGMGMLGGESEFYPYVSITLNADGT
jgi:hypothetical protein